MLWTWLGRFGHDRDGDAVFDNGHDEHGRGKGLGHRDRGDDCDDGSGKASGGGSHGWGNGSDGSGGGSHGGGSGSHGGGSGSHGGGSGSHGGGSGSGPDDDYLCGGNDCTNIEVSEEQTAVVDLASPFGTNDADTLYTIVGGDDSLLFEIDAATGELAFKTAPEFETPTDEGGNNVYEVTVRTTSTLNPCKSIETSFCVEVTEDDGGQGGAPALIVVEEDLNPTPGTARPDVVRIAGSSANIADYEIRNALDSSGNPIDEDADALELIAAPDDTIPDDGLTEFLVRGEGGVVTFAAIRETPTDPDVDYDFQVVLTVDGVEATTGALSVDIVSSA